VTERYNLIYGKNVIDFVSHINVFYSYLREYIPVHTLFSGKFELPTSDYM